ncbi:MAG: CRTAC1 family protein [Luteitalea sp.]
MRAQPAAGLRFEDSADAAGLHFTHVNGARGEFWMPEMMGAGVALFDYDGDGDLDVHLVQGSETGIRAPDTAAAAPSPEPQAPARRGSRLFRNDLDRPGGTLRFTDVTDQAGVALVGQGMGVAVGDFDNDGDLDLYVTTFGDDALYRNDGNGRFTDVTAAAGVSDPHWSTSAAFVDYDRDGHLDLFVANYLDFTPQGNKRCTEAAGARDYCAPTAYRPVPDRLYHNRGDGTFEDVTDRAGISRAHGNGLGVSVGDYDADGWPDIYVANDATPNQLWMNRRDGTFEDAALLSGTAYNAAGRPEGSMGIASGDYDRDGDEDMVVTNLIGESFVLYENDGTGGFEDRRAAVGLAAPTAMMTGFGAGWFDADNDGWLDLFVANGAVNLIPALRGTPNPYRQRNQLFLGQPVAATPRPAGGARATPAEAQASETRPGSSVRLLDVTDRAGPGLELLEVSRGAAFGDLDLDGRVDVVVSNNGGPARLLRNVSTSAGHWLRLRLSQPGGNRWAVGALVTVDGPAGSWAAHRVTSAGSYLSASALDVHVGLGEDASNRTARVTWPDGTVQQFEGLTVDREHLLARRAPP